VVAYRKGDMNKVFSLQDKLMLSWKVRALAVRITTTSVGGKTPGIDNVV
jgi:hypothetical protein